MIGLISVLKYSQRTFEYTDSTSLTSISKWIVQTAYDGGILIHN